jgi:hypothetical protein
MGICRYVHVACAFMMLFGREEQENKDLVATTFSEDRKGKSLSLVNARFGNEFERTRRRFFQFAYVCQILRDVCYGFYYFLVLFFQLSSLAHLYFLIFF